MGRHNVPKPRIKREPIIDPNNTQEIKHACGCVKTYSGLPKFNPPALQAEIEFRSSRPCKACKIKAKEEAKKAAAEAKSA